MLIFYLASVLLVSIRVFAGDGKNIRLLTTEFLLRAATVELAKPKYLWYWMSRNAVLLLPFLTETVITDG